jgi:hypothetical protein
MPRAWDDASFFFFEATLPASANGEFWKRVETAPTI